MDQTTEKKEVELILASRPFHAGRPSETLRFLCDQHWSEEPAEVTQYDIADALCHDVTKLKQARTLILRLRERLDMYYAGEGRNRPLRLHIPLNEYRLEFRKQEIRKPSDHPSPPKSGRPKGWYALIIAAAVMLFAIGFVFSRGSRTGPTNELSVPQETPQMLAAASVTGDGLLLTGRRGNDQPAWQHTLASPIVGVKKLRAPEGSSSRFLVVCGGWIPGEPFNKGRPSVEFYSALGEPLTQPIDLLDWFNPFEGAYRDDLFELKVHDPVDFNRDGYLDGIVSCRHKYYPTLIYFISGGDLGLSGAFANSGRCNHVEVGIEIPSETARSLPVGVVGMNNRMGSQHVFFLASTNSRRFSPDIIGTQNKNSWDYRLLGNQDWRDITLKSEETGGFTIQGDSESISFNRLLARESDPWFNNGTATEGAKESLAEFYKQVREARIKVLCGEVTAGIDQYGHALVNAIDWPTEYYVLMDAATSLRQAGEPALALEWLPADRTISPNSGSVAYLEGELRLLLGQPDSASQLFLDTLSHPEQHGRYECSVHAMILRGDSPREIHDVLTKDFIKYIGYPVTRSWLGIPGLLSGELSSMIQDVKVLPLPEDEIAAGEEFLYYPHQQAIWQALADLELHRSPSIWPDETMELAAAGEQEDMVRLHKELLVAVNVYQRENPVHGRYLLGQCYLNLEEASRREPRAIVPFVYAAYRYGFAACEAGFYVSGRSALTQALHWYPSGLNADKARALLRGYGK